MPKFSTRYKVAVGYILLTLLLITTMGYVYRIMKGMGGRGDGDGLLSARRSITSEVMNDLNRAEIVVQAIAIGKTNEYGEYKEIMSSVDRAIDSLQNITDDLQNSERLKTIRMFINMKNSNMSRLMTIIDSNDITELYNNEINAIISLQDSLLAKNGKQGYPDYVAETIAGRLKNIRFKVSADHSEQVNRLNSQMQSLRLSSLLLNDEVRLLLNEIEDEESLLEQARTDKNEKVRNRAYMIISGIAVVSILLAAWFMYFISRDITRSNHYRSELEKAKQRAEDLLDAKDKLMLTITHDIKAPVGSIIGYAELLGNIITGERQQFYLKNMQDSADHLLQLVNSLLDFHRLDADKMDRQSVPFNVKELFDGIMNSYRPIADSKNIELVNSCDAALDCVFKSDPLRIRQIIENIVGNALKFTNEGSVTVDAALDHDTFQIVVCDTGCGMAKNELKQVFKEFTRLNNAQGKEGFGLGLAITNKLVRLLGGDISVDSELGKGTIFTVRLPLERTSSLPVEAVKDDADMAVPSARLLLIDDDPLQLSMMEAMLQQISLDVTTCNHPDELFIHLQQQMYDVIITDIQMPAMNGIELIGKIKEMPTVCDIPVVAMTARSDVDAVMLSGHGFSACLHKPFTIRELVQVIAGVVKPGGSRFDFGQLAAFSMDDTDAKAEIMKTFIVETKKKREILSQACSRHDMQTITMITHQLLPLFVMVGAVDGKENLEWFEKCRNEVEYSDEADARVKAIISEVDNMTDEAEKELAFNK